MLLDPPLAALLVWGALARTSLTTGRGGRLTSCRQRLAGPDGSFGLLDSWSGGAVSRHPRPCSRSLITSILVAELVAMPRGALMPPGASGTGSAQGWDRDRQRLQCRRHYVVFLILWVDAACCGLPGSARSRCRRCLAFLNQRLFRYDALAEHAARTGAPRGVCPRGAGSTCSACCWLSCTTFHS